MMCIAMIVNDYTMPETKKTAGFTAFTVRSNTIRRANCELCALRVEGCALLSEGTCDSCLYTHLSICLTRTK